MFYLGGDVLLQELGTIDLEAGKHEFMLELIERRKMPDNAWCLEFEGIVLRPLVTE